MKIYRNTNRICDEKLLNMSIKTLFVKTLLFSYNLPHYIDAYIVYVCTIFSFNFHTLY